MNAIKAAAIRYCTITMTSWKVVRGANHDDCLSTIHEMGYHETDIDRLEKGFVDTYGVFHNRYAAYLIAKDAGQLKCENDDEILYSYNVFYQ